MKNKTENDFGGHVSCGVVGIQHLMRTLTDYGRGDLALKLATNDTYPSWGYMVRNGATTITGSLITAEDIPLCGHAALRDTMTDLILDLVGSLLVAIFGIFYHDKAIEKYDILIKMMKIDNEGIAENVE